MARVLVAHASTRPCSARRLRRAFGALRAALAALPEALRDPRALGFWEKGSGRAGCREVLSVARQGGASAGLFELVLVRGNAAQVIHLLGLELVHQLIPRV